MILPPSAPDRLAGIRRRQACAVAAVAAIIGLSRMTLYRARYGGPVSEDMAELLTPLVRCLRAGKLRFQRSGPRSRDPNQSEWSGTMFT